MLIRAAKYLGVAPWELRRQSVVWQDWALKAIVAEAHKRKIDSERQERAIKRSRGKGR